MGDTARIFPLNVLENVSLRIVTMYGIEPARKGGANGRLKVFRFQTLRGLYFIRIQIWSEAKRSDILQSPWAKSNPYVPFPPPSGLNAMLFAFFQQHLLKPIFAAIFHSDGPRTPNLPGDKRVMTQTPDAAALRGSEGDEHEETADDTAGSAALHYCGITVAVTLLCHPCTRRCNNASRWRER